MRYNRPGEIQTRKDIISPLITVQLHGCPSLALPCTQCRPSKVGLTRGHPSTRVRRCRVCHRSVSRSVSKSFPAASFFGLPEGLCRIVGLSDGSQQSHCSHWSGAGWLIGASCTSGGSKGGLGFVLRPAATVQVMPACNKELGGRPRRWAGIVLKPRPYYWSISGTFATRSCLCLGQRIILMCLYALVAWHP